MKLLLPLFLILSSTASLADCYTALSQGGKDSITYQMSNIDLESTHNSARHALKKLLVKLECDSTKITSFKCQEIVKGQHESEVCYARSEIGYFIINQDYLDNVNIIFNRLD